MSLASSFRPSIARLAGAAGTAMVAALLVAGQAAAAWPSQAYPTQSAGDRGTDVSAIQLLLRFRGIPMTLTGIFDVPTVTAVKQFEVSAGQKPDGIVDRLLWPRLTPRLEPGAKNAAVTALQKELNQKRGLHLTEDGVYGAATRTAVLGFQRHAGLIPNAIVGASTWQALLWHFELPHFSTATMLCDYAVGNGAANWGTAAAIAQIEAAGKAIGAKGLGRIAVGDVGLEHGGDIPLHMTHERGLDVDIRPMKRSRNQCIGGTNWRLATYDRTATRTLIRTIRATAPGHVKLIYFNDPVLIREGLTTWFAGHDDHLHVRYCEAIHPLAMYDC
jgi:peptidoglycan hydrolase-like protein with peptidoglycan-binding domain